MENYEKKYKEALGWMQSLYDGLHGATKEDAEHYFPELKESEDEQSKKWILEYLYDGLRKSDEQFKGQFKTAIAWLEKQGEQKPVDKVEPKFKIESGKWYVCNTPRYTDFVVGKAYYCSKNGMLKPNGNEMARYVARDCFHLWTIQDAKDGDVLVDVYGNIGIFKERYGINWHTYCYLGNEGRFISEGGSHGSICYPATKEQRDTFEKAMADSGYTFDFNKKELKKIEDKSAWSEEDDTVLNNLIYALANDRIGNDRDEYISWLKSLKNRVQPQPKQEWSEEDDYNLQCMIAKVTSDIQKGNVGRNQELIDWLKSIRPQNN